MPKCKIMAICNEKGGVGKSTTSLNLSTALAMQGYKVLVIDCDCQANLTMSMGFEPDELDITLSDLMIQMMNIDKINDEKSKYILRHEGVDLIPADIKLSGIESSLVNVMSRELMLKNIVDEFKDEYNYIIFDCAPSLGLITINALAASESVIIPVQAQFLSMKGMELLLKTIARVRRQINRDLYVEGILLTMFDKRTNLSKDVKNALEENYGKYIRIFKSVINYSVRAAESPAHGTSIFEYDPKGTIASSYKEMAEELISFNG